MSADKRAIRTDQAPTPTGPFNQAIRVGNLVFTAGQAGRNRETGQMGDIREQTDWALRNLAAILEFPHDSPKIDNRAHGQACPKRRRRIDILLWRL